MWTIALLLACAPETPQPADATSLAETTALPDMAPPPVPWTTTSSPTGAAAVDGAFDSAGDLWLVSRNFGLAGLGGTELWLDKIARDGTVLWSSWGLYTAARMTELRGVAVDSADRAIAVGMYDRYQVWVGAFSNSGVEQWVWTAPITDIANYGTDAAVDVAVGPGDQIYVVGRIDNDGWIASFASDGTPLWSDTWFAFDGIRHYWRVVVAADGTVVACGAETDNPVERYRLAAYDAAGLSLWTASSPWADAGHNTTCNDLDIDGSTVLFTGEYESEARLDRYDLATGARLSRWTGSGLAHPEAAFVVAPDQAYLVGVALSPASQWEPFAAGVGASTWSELRPSDLWPLELIEDRTGGIHALGTVDDGFSSVASHGAYGWITQVL